MCNERSGIIEEMKLNLPCHAVLLLACTSGLSANAAEDIVGAGATFPARLYGAWASAYEKSTGVRMAYEPADSGVALERVHEYKVDFAGAEEPLPEHELARTQLLQFPVILDGAVPVINIRGIKPGQLKLNGCVLADIYLGRIRKWNDARITDLNVGLPLPNTNITVVYRSDPTLTSRLWTHYLARCSHTWRTQVGISRAPRWPTGVGGFGDEGVASYIQRTRLAIGYLEYKYARKYQLDDIALRNPSGHFVRADPATLAAAAETAGWNGTIASRPLTTDATGNPSWPLTEASFVLIRTSGRPSGRTLEVLKFFNWVLHDGQSIALELGYVPVPKAVADKLSQSWGAVRDEAGRAIWPPDH